MGRVEQPVDRALGKQGVRHHGQPLLRLRIGDDHRAGPTVALDNQLIDFLSLLVVIGLNRRHYG